MAPIAIPTDLDPVLRSRLRSLDEFQQSEDGMKWSELLLDASKPPSAMRGFKAAATLYGLLEEFTTAQVRAARGNGWSWAEIGRVLGMTRQGARQRYQTCLERAEVERAD